MKYSIIAFYQTGNSFGHEDTTEEVLTHDSLELAKSNLVRIKEHYAFKEKIEHSYSSRQSYREIIKAHADKPWFVNEPRLYHVPNDQAVDTMKKGKEHEYEYRPDPTQAENCLILQTDTGEPYRLWAPWCGYFERLHSVEIQLVQDESMKYAF
jgi:hypothetical protein